MLLLFVALNDCNFYLDDVYLRTRMYDSSFKLILSKVYVGTEWHSMTSFTYYKYLCSLFNFPVAIYELRLYNMYVLHSLFSSF